MARLIIEVFERAWMLEFHSAKVLKDDDCEGEQHITVGGSFELSDDEEDEEADEAGQRKFGFG